MFTPNPETKKDILSDFSTEREITSTKKVGNNTVRIDFKDGGYIIRYHHTDIIDVLPNGDILVYNGGWNTNTTRDKLNEFFPRDKLSNFTINFFIREGGIRCFLKPIHSQTFPPQIFPINKEVCLNNKFILKSLLTPNTI